MTKRTSENPNPRNSHQRMAAAFATFDKGLAYLEDEDPNDERILEVMTAVHDGLIPYHLIHDEKRRKTSDVAR